MSAASEPAPGGVNWGQLYAEHRDAMFRVATAGLRAARRSDIEAVDLVNEAFTSVMSNPPAEVDDWEKFLITVTVRRFRDYLKSADHRHTYLAAGDDDAPTVEPLPAEDTAEVAIRRVRASGTRDLLLHAMGSLTTRQQEVARLLLFDGLAVGAIAAKLDTSSANISQLIKKSLARLEEVLVEFDGVETADIEQIRPTRRPGGAA
ncbi:RNA polymerase sigma factor (sigma-70 family) [Lentzea atacamensis]|uniref:RNA polymerase sigma factor (Sigma-70 family) n=1 Tax=Lentzea atacamensis TaxID=531938 RepID=A0A316IBC6_9PSEU|nr:RNA polymerase sigma factor (sigma-70 family) [Lentzea atacamensis]